MDLFYKEHGWFINLSSCVSRLKFFRLVIPFHILSKCNCSSNLHLFLFCVYGFPYSNSRAADKQLVVFQAGAAFYCPVYVWLIPDLRGLRGFYHLQVKIPLKPFRLGINRQALR
jgi:hypothetical protein